MLFHGAGKGDGAANSLKNMIVVKRLAFVKRIIERAVNHLRYFASTKSFRGIRKIINGEAGVIAALEGEVDGKDFAAFLVIRQIDKEDFIEAAFSEEFRRQT